MTVVIAATLVVIATVTATAVAATAVAAIATAVVEERQWGGGSHNGCGDLAE